MKKISSLLAIATLLAANVSASYAQTNPGTANASSGAIVHLQGTSNQPAIAAGAGAGTGPTVALSSNSTDLAGKISVTTGTSPTASAVVVTITFATPYTVAPNVVLGTNSNGVTAALSGNAALFLGTVSTTSFQVKVGSSALSGSAGPFVVDYIISQ